MIYFKFSFLGHTVLHIGSQFPDKPGVEPIPPAMEVRSLNHWTAREVPKDIFF